MEIVAADLRQGYITICQRVTREGSPVRVRGLRTAEITGCTLILNPYTCMLPIGTGRKVNLKLAAVESLCMIGGVWRHDLVTRAAPRYSEVLVSGDNASAAHYSAYGPRISAQLKTIIKQLQGDPTTRQAILSIWSPDDLVYHGDKPCTISLQFILRHSKLECHAYMRSQDVWLGLAMDAFVFTQVQHTIAHILGVSAGKYVHHVGSLHSYERDWAKINDLSLVSAQVTPILPEGLNTQDPVQSAQDLLNGKRANAPWYEHQVGAVLEHDAS